MILDAIFSHIPADILVPDHIISVVLPHMLAQRAGSIVITSSMDGKKGVPPDAAYAATKFALNGFQQVLRQELRGSGGNLSGTCLQAQFREIICILRIDSPRAFC